VSAQPMAFSRPSPQVADERAWTREAFDLTSDLMAPNQALYWADLIATAAVTYASLALAAVSRTPALVAGAGLVAAAALYRAVSFIHEAAHLRRGDVPGFKLGWTLLVGIPFLTPPLMYDGVHNLHHSKHRYGGAGDPEYLPLAHGSPRQLIAFVLIALLAPVGVILRFAVLAPLSFLIPPLRRLVVRRMSALTINPAFEREDVGAARRPAWLAQEIACWLWSWLVIGLTVAGALPLRAVLTAIAVFSLFAFVNQLRTAVAHAWENTGERMSFIAQFQDSMNVPPPSPMAAVWAPVGLRYHALHHLLPRLPYHNLGAAHRRLATAALGPLYRSVERPGLLAGLRQLAARTRAAG
jgi:fatty acid desaturase